MFTLIVKNRGDSDQWEARGRVEGVAQWTSLGKFTGRSADITWPGGGANPIRVEVIVQLIKKNENYGQLSQPFILTLNP